MVRRPAGYSSARISVSSLEYVSTRGIAKGPHRRHALFFFGVPSRFAKLVALTRVDLRNRELQTPQELQRPELSTAEVLRIPLTCASLRQGIVASPLSLVRDSMVL